MTPDFTISADTKDATASIKARLLSLEISDSDGIQSDRLTIKLDDRDQALEMPRTGAELAVSLGYVETTLTDMGKWAVDTVDLSSPPNTMTIHANAINLSSSSTASGKTNTLKQPKTRAWDNISIADIVVSIAKEHGYTSRVAAKYATGTIPAVGAPIQHLDQFNESDMSFLTRLAVRYGAMFKPVNGFILFVEKGTPLSVTGRVLKPLVLHARQVSSWNLNLTERGKYVSCSAYYHDMKTGKRVRVFSGSATGSPSTGAVGTFHDEQSALAAANAKLASANRGARKLNITMVGDPMIAAGMPIDIRGFRAGVDGKFVCKKVSHQLSDAGFVTTIKSETYA